MKVKGIKKKKRLKEIMDKIYKPYYNLFFITVFIAVLGILMITSATYTESGLFYVSRQVTFILIGILFMITGAHIDIVKWLYKSSKFLYVLCILLLILLVTPLGVSSHGATRWLRVPFIQLQPVELAKLAIIVLLSAFIYRKNRYCTSEPVKKTL